MLSRFSVKRPYTVFVVVIIVLILGAISFLNLKTDLLPDIDLPYLLIMTSYPGASPEEVEMVVTKPIEQVVATTANIKNISSISRENSSVVILEFNHDVNMDSAIIEINGMLDLIKPTWNETVGAPLLMRLNPDMLPIMVASVDVEDMDLLAISQLVKQKIVPELESVEGVASVSGAGLIEEKVQVLLDDQKIEGINKRVLDKVASGLSAVGEKLAAGQKEIEEGRKELESEKNKQEARLAEGEEALRAAREEMEDGLAQISTGEQRLDEVQEELQAKLDELNDREKNLQALRKGIRDTLVALPRMDGDELKSTMAGILNQVPREMKDVLPPQLAEIERKLNSGEGISKVEAAQCLALLSQGLESGLETLASGREEINKGLDELAKQRAELAKNRQLILSQKGSLDGKEQEIRTAKFILAQEMDKARAQLESGEKELKGKQGEFESAKKEALKKASLDGTITPAMISGILGAQNFSMPAGTITESGGDYLVKVGDKFRCIEDLGEMVLFDTGEENIGKIYLKDVARISKVDNSGETYAKVNGNNAVMLTFQKQSGFSTAAVAGSLREKFEDISGQYDDLTITPLMDQGVYIDLVVDSVLNNVIYGGILAVLILLLFLKNIKPTLIIAVSIPISLIFAIAMMYFTGVAINIISLAGLALGVGMLVDNSIVVIENIYRLRNEGKSAVAASIEGAKEISGAIISSTLTTVCVFLPIVFVKGISRQLFVDMGLTIAYALLASLLVALTLVPAMASGTLQKVGAKRNKTFDRLAKIYVRALRWALGHRAAIILAVTVMMGLSLFLGLSMGTAFIPEMEAPQMSLFIELPDGEDSGDLVAISDTVTDRLMGLEGIKAIGAFQGGGMGGSGDSIIGGGLSGGSSNGYMNFYLLLDEEKKVKNSWVEEQILELTDDLNCEVSVSSSNMDISSLAGSGIEVLIKGRELDTLQEISADIASILEGVGGTTAVSDGIDESMAELRIVVDKEKAMENGLTVAQVYSNVSAAISKGKTATILSTPDKDYPVIVLDEAGQKIGKDDLRGLTMTVDKDGQKKEVALGDLFQINEGRGLAAINHDSLERYIAVTADIETGYNIGLVSREFQDKIKDYHLPEGYRIETGGENRLINTSLMDLVYMLILAIALIYLIMVAQFQSLLSPFIVMFTIPLAFTGGLIALFLTGYEISLISMLGFLVLSGVVVNNGIVFVDFTNQLREGGLDVREALVRAGETRLRPILMTAITTILGLSTLSLGVGTGAEMLQPLAIVSIGGLIYATGLTLLVVPVIYDLLHRERGEKMLEKRGE